MSDPMLCPSCYAEPTTGGRLCRPCAGRRARGWWAAGIAVGVVGLVVGSIIVVRAFDDDTILTAREAEEREAEEREAKAREAETSPLAATGPDVDSPTAGELKAIAACDATALDSVLDSYKRAESYTALVRAGRAYQKACKPVLTFEWEIMYGHEQLEEWQQAHAISDQLVRDDPGDTDYWYWRGNHRRRLSRMDAALVDLRQSLTDASQQSNGVQIGALDDAASPLGQRCEAAFALRWLEGRGVELSESARRKFRDIYSTEDCAKLDGHGGFAWAKAGLKIKKLTGTIDGRRVTVAIDGGLGTTLIRREVAEKLKMKVGAEVDVQTPAGPGTACTSVAVITVDKAKASDVAFGIVDDLPEGIDVVIGLNFLWRFEVEEDDQGRFVATTWKSA